MSFSDFNKLRTFVEVAKLGSITKAADRLFRTQSAITQQIQQLEESLELTLLHRKSNRVFLTKEGQHLFELSEKMFSHLEQEIESLKGNLASLTGTISIGIRSDISQIFLPTYIEQFKKKYPKVRFELTHGNPTEIEQKVNNLKMKFLDKYSNQ